MLIFLSFAAAIFVSLINGSESISGGKVTNIENHPYMVSLHHGYSHVCDGVIIGKSIILTAAHCIRRDVNEYEIRTGSTFCTDREPKKQEAKSHRLESVIIHEKYEKVYLSQDIRLDPVFAYDIALVKVKTSFEFNDKTKVSTLFDADEQVEKSNGTVVGWGSVPRYELAHPDGLDTIQTFEASFYNRLRSVDLNIVDKKTCAEEYLKSYNYTLRPGQLCAGGKVKDSCMNDEGGPLMVDGKLAGLVSWGYQCGLSERPAIYTEVAYFRKWIDENVKKLTDNQTVKNE